MTTQALRALIARLETFADRKSALISDRQRIVASADASLDPATCSKFAAADAGIRLAEAVEAGLLEQTRGATAGLLEADNRVRALRVELLGALRQSLEAKVPAELKGSVRIEDAEAYKQEEAGGYLPNVSSFQPSGFGKDVGVTLRHLRDIAAELERCEREIERLTSRLKKLR